MPRRKNHVALQAALTQGWVGVRFLLRNPEFRKDLAHCYNLEPLSANHEQTMDWWGLIEKWDLAWVPMTWPKTGPGPLGEVVRLEEEFLRGEMLASKEDPNISQRFLFRLPVEAWDPDKQREEQWLQDSLEKFKLRNKIPRPPSLKPPGRFLMIRVDISYPQDVLEEVIKLELKKAKRQISPLKKTTPGKKQGKTGQSRNRLDKATLQIRIFDLVAEGALFPDIARRLRKPVSTVKSIFLAASHKVWGPSHDRLRSKDVPLVYFDSETHVQKCPTCLSALNQEDLCMLSQAYARQDYKSQREQIYGNVDAIPRHEASEEPRQDNCDEPFEEAFDKSYENASEEIDHNSPDTYEELCTDKYR